MNKIALAIDRAAANGASRRRSRWALSAIGAASALSLSGCGGSDDCVHCVSGIPAAVPTEFSLGLVAGNFAGNGLASVIETTAIDNGSQPNPGDLKIYLQTAPGSFAAPTLTATGNDPIYLASADLDRDNLPDVVASNAQDGTLDVFFNNPKRPGTFVAPVVLSSPGTSQVAIADVNGDGLPDLVSADYNVSLFLQTAPGTFAHPIALDSGGANWVAVGDLDHDGVADVALSDNSGVKIVFHTGAPSAHTYAPAAQIYAESRNVAVQGANVVAIADVNGDGFNDLIITDPGPIGNRQPFVAVMLQNRANPGSFLAPVAYATASGSVAQSLEVVDVDGDGLPDLIVGGSDAISVLFNNPAAPGTFDASDDYAAIDANQVAFADVNGDGLPDIITTTGATHPRVNGVYTNGPGVLLQSRSVRGTFTALQNLP